MEQPKTTDLHVVSNVPLAPPRQLVEEIPPGEGHAALVAGARDGISAALFGRDLRFFSIAGPCSIHDTGAGLEYAKKFAALAAEVKDRILMVMRVYFEKPRTTVGWKGLIMDPHLDGSDDIQEGLRRARRFLVEVLDLGVPTATELLDPITPQYLSDLLCWAAIGARTSESQTHRQMASGLSMPVGFKNLTSGDVGAAANALRAARQSQTFLGVNLDGVASAVTTRGNPNGHVILRGGENGDYGPADVAAACGLLEEAGLPPAVLVDASHANCQKDDALMPGVFAEIVAQRAAGDRSIIGAMLESNLVAGAQDFPRPLADLTYGQSITDRCIDWETTERVVRAAAEELG